MSTHRSRRDSLSPLFNLVDNIGSSCRLRPFRRCRLGGNANTLLILVNKKMAEMAEVCHGLIVDLSSSRW
jgi:hypothetical protein